MLGTPSVNDIESAYGSQQGLQSLSQKVAQEPKGPAGLPSDLKDLIALDDLQQQMQSAQTQQNLQNPTNMPTVADQLKQKIMAMEQARQQQAMMARAQQQGFRPQGYGQYQPSAMQMQPMQPTQGMPQQPQQPQQMPPQHAASGGLMHARIPGHMFHFSQGGILHFDEGGAADNLPDSMIPKVQQAETPSTPLTLGVPITNADQQNIYADLFSSKDPGVKRVKEQLKAQEQEYLRAIAKDPNMGVQNQQAVQADQMAQAAQAAPQANPALPATGAGAGRGGQGGPNADQLGLGAIAPSAQPAPQAAPQARPPVGAPVAAQPGAQKATSWVNPYEAAVNAAHEAGKSYEMGIQSIKDHLADQAEFDKANGVDRKQIYETHKNALAQIDAAREAANAAHERANKAQGLENVWYTLANMRGGRASDALANSAIAGQNRVDQQRAAEETYQQQNMVNMMKQQAAKQALDDAQIALSRGDFKGWQDNTTKAKEINAGIYKAGLETLTSSANRAETVQGRKEIAADNLAMRRQLAQGQQQQHADAMQQRMDQKEADREAGFSKQAMSLAMGAATKALADPMNMTKYKGMSAEEVAASMYPRILQGLKTGAMGEAAPKDFSTQAQSAFGAYEPNKYDYRINPETGVLQRKLKG